VSWGCASRGYTIIIREREARRGTDATGNGNTTGEDPHPTGDPHRGEDLAEDPPPEVGLYKIFVDFEAIVHESTIRPFPPPTCIGHPGAILLHDYWTVYDSPSDLPFVCYTPFNIGNKYIV